MPQYEDIDWVRVSGYNAPADGKVKLSWIWTHGYRLVNDAGLEHWLCKHCHHGKIKYSQPKPQNNTHVFVSQQATSTPRNHLEKRHHIVEEGATPRLAKAAGQKRTIDGYCKDNLETSPAWRPALFKALLLRWVVASGISFRKLENAELRELLRYLNPKTEGLVPVHSTVSCWISKAYDHQLGVVTEALQSSISRVNLSFDMWTSGNQLAVLGAIAHFIDIEGSARHVLLGLPEHKGVHNGVNLAETVGGIIAHWHLQDRLGYFTVDNASSNDKCLEYLGREWDFDPPQRQIRCCGHVLNLVCKAILFGNDCSAFENEMADVVSEEQDLLLWRRKGPNGKLHNIVKYITRSPQRIQRFEAIQLRNLCLRPDDKKHVYKLVQDNATRWNSYYACARRALDLQNDIDEFILQEQLSFESKRRRESSSHRPTIVNDKLDADDWHTIGLFVDLLKPFKDATLRLEGHSGKSNAGMWLVLPMYERLMQHLEEKKGKYTIRESLGNACNQPELPDTFATSRHHLSAAINLGWIKLDQYYNRLDDNDIYIAAVLLHPVQKWRWFEKHWHDHQDWIVSARTAFQRLWRTHKDELVEQHFEAPTQVDNDQVTEDDSEDEWATEASSKSKDQYQAYLEEAFHPQLKSHHSPIEYWLSKRQVWPQLAQLALNIYSAAPMSDEPERLFSEAGDILAPKRRQMTGQTLAQLLSLKKWQRDKLITLDGSLFERAINAAERPALSLDQSVATVDIGDGEESRMVTFHNPMSSE